MTPVPAGTDRLEAIARKIERDHAERHHWAPLTQAWYDRARLLSAEVARLMQERDGLRATLDSARDLVIRVMDKDIGQISEDARTTLGEINRTLNDLPTEDELHASLAAVSSSPATTETSET